MVAACYRGQETAPTGCEVFVGAPTFGAMIAACYRGQETAPTGCEVFVGAPTFGAMVAACYRGQHPLTRRALVPFRV